MLTTKADKPVDGVVVDILRLVKIAAANNLFNAFLSGLGGL